MSTSWAESEVIAFVEVKIMDNIADTDEVELYEEFIWNDIIDKKSCTYKWLVHELNTYYKTGGM